VFLLAAIRQSRGEGAAIDRARAMLIDDPDNPGLHEVLANNYRAVGQLGRAIGEYELTHRLRPGDAFAAAQITFTYLLMDDPDAAARWAIEAESRGAGNRWADVARDVVNYYNGEFESIISARRPQLVNPQENFNRLNRFLAEVQIQLGQRSDATLLLRLTLESSGVMDQGLAEDDQARMAALLAHLLSPGEEREAWTTRLRDYQAMQRHRTAERPDYWRREGWLAVLDSDRERMLAALEQGFTAGLRGARWLERDPLFEEYADDPGLRAVVLKLEAESEALRAATRETTG